MAVGAIGLIAVTAALVFHIAGRDEAPAPSLTETLHAPTPSDRTADASTGGRRPPDDLDTYLLEHFDDDPIGCLRRLGTEREKVRGTPNEARIAALIRHYEDRVNAPGKGEFERRLLDARKAEGDLRFGEALAALGDLPDAKDPLGHWNAKLGAERDRVRRAAMEEWRAIAARAVELAREGRGEAALIEAARGGTFGIPEIETEALNLRAELSAIAAAANAGRSAEAAPQPDGGTPPSDPNSAIEAVGRDVLASLVRDGAAEGRATTCPLCDGTEARLTRTCGTCQGGKRATCPMCKGTGTWSCPAGVHQAGNSFVGEERDPAHVKKILSRCKSCDDKPEKRCAGCRGSKTISCRPCSGKGRVDWTCPLRSIHAAAKKAADASCVLCMGQAQPTCPVCGGGGTCAGEGCGECADLGKVPCGTCRGAGRAPCGRCGGSGRVRTLTKAGAFFDGSTGTSGSDAGGRPDASSCDMCKSNGYEPCAACSRLGMVRCGSCKGEDAKHRACWACDGKRTLARCPACAAGTLACGRTTDGAAVYLLPLSDLHPLIDRGIHGVLGSPREWMVLIVDNREGSRTVTWTGELGALALRSGDLTRVVPRDEVDRAGAFKRAIEADGRLFGLHPGALTGSKVEAGSYATFLLPCAASPRVGEEVVIQSGDASTVARLARGALDAPARRALLARFWNDDGMKRR